MELTFRLTREEHQRFARLCVARVRQHARQATGWLSKPLVLTVAAVLLGLLPLEYLLFAELISPLAYFVAAFTYMWGAICVGLCMRLTQRVLLRCWLPDDSPSLAESRLKLVSDGIETADANSTENYSWRAFREVSEDGELVLLWLDRAKAIVVPGRAFANADLRQSFIDTIRGHLASAST